MEISRSQNAIPWRMALHRCSDAPSIQSARRGIVALAALSALSLSSSATAQPVELGLVSGDVRFVDVSTAVGSFFDANPPVGGIANAVGCFPSGGPPSAGATTAYVVENETPSPDVRRAASYSIQPPAAATGSDFLVEVRFLDFANAARYRFGARLAGLPGEHRCNDVEPQSSDPGGARCDLEECAALARVRVRLTGVAADLDTLQDLGGCVVTATEGPGITPQASSGPAVQPLAVFRSTGVTIPMLVRGSGTLRYSVGCSFPVPEGEQGFPIDPTTGLAVFSTEETVDVALECGEERVLDIDVPVERIAGVLTGMFDLSGQDEIDARVALNLPGFTSTPPFFAASQTPTRGDDGSYWRFENVPEGAWIVTASAILDQGNALSQFPTTRPPNDPAIVAAEQETDLDATFIGRPAAAEGRVVLMDLGAGTELAQLQTDVFSDVGAGDINNPRTSRAEVTGILGQVPGAGGGSAFEAKALGRLRGTFDAEGRAELDYRAWLAGMSPLEASTDGSATLRTGWELSQYALRLGQSPGNSQRVGVQPRLFFPIETEAGGGGGPFEIPERHICFGEAEVEMRIAAAEGTIFGPSLDMSGFAPVTASATVVPEASSYAARVSAQGTPRALGGAATQAVTIATLPEGIQYPLTPRVSFLPPGSATAQALTLPIFSMPGQGTITCGDRQGVCLFIRASEGDYQALSLTVDPDVAYCQQAFGAIDFEVNVGSSGAEVDYVLYRVDEGPEQYLCVGCGPDPGPLAVQIADLGGLATGAHSVEIEAHSDNGCDGFATQNFEISDQPLTITCDENPPALVLAPAEESIPGSDPRVDEILQATVGGGCDLPIEVEDDRPAEFLPGETEVTLRLPNGQSCPVAVRVIWSRRQLTYIDDGDIVARRLEDDAEQFRLTNIAGPSRVTYDHQGERLAIVGDGAVTVVDADDGGSPQVFPGAYLSVAFRPTNNQHLAFLRSEAGVQPHGDYRVVVALTDQGVTFESEPLGFIPGWTMTAPEIAWSEDGTRLLAATDAALSTPPEARLLMWELTLGSDGLAMQSGDWQRERQQILGVAYLTPSSRGLFTTRGVHTFGDNTVLVDGFQRNVSSVGLPTPPTPVAAFYETDGDRIGVLTEGGFAEGPEFAGKPGVAISEEQRRVAVADTVGGRVVVYRLQIQTQPLQITFVEDRSYPSQPGQSLAFRPVAP